MFDSKEAQMDIYDLGMEIAQAANKAFDMVALREQAMESYQEYADRELRTKMLASGREMLEEAQRDYVKASAYVGKLIGPVTISPYK